MKRTLAALIIGISALTGATVANATDEVKVAAVTDEQAAAIKKAHDAKPTFNFFDPTTWATGFGQVKHGEMIEFDPANPRDWAKPFDPKTHQQWHMTVMNPVFYAKFMTPGYYMKFMDPKTWFAYMDFSSYDQLMKVSMAPQTYTYWMNPGSYMHFADPAMYTASMDPNAYIKMSGEVIKGYGDVATADATNVFNPFSWMKMFADATTAMTPTTGETKKAQ